MNNVSLSGKVYGLQTRIVGAKNTEIASFRVGAYNSRLKKSFYFPVTVFGKNDFMEKFFSVDGQPVEITGRLEVEEWEKENVKHSKTVVIANEIDFVPRQNTEKTEKTEDSAEQTEQPENPAPTNSTNLVELPSPDEVPF